jgi:hypothetical protein
MSIVLFDILNILVDRRLTVEVSAVANTVDVIGIVEL